MQTICTICLSETQYVHYIRYINHPLQHHSFTLANVPFTFLLCPWISATKLPIKTRLNNYFQKQLIENLNDKRLKWLDERGRVPE